jgi:hypothetical protein
MRFRAGLVIGAGVGYYLGAMAGRERYEQMSSLLRRARGSDTFETVEKKARAVLDLGMERARDAVESRIGNGSEPDLVLS